MVLYKCNIIFINTNIVVSGIMLQPKQTLDKYRTWDKTYSVTTICACIYYTHIENLQAKILIPLWIELLVDDACWL